MFYLMKSRIQHYRFSLKITQQHNKHVALPTISEFISDSQFLVVQSENEALIVGRENWGPIKIVLFCIGQDLNTFFICHTFSLKRPNLNQNWCKYGLQKKQSPLGGPGWRGFRRLLSFLDGKTLVPQNYRIVAAIDMDFHIHFLENFRRSLWMIMVLAGAVTLLAAWYGVRQGHAPLRELSATMSDIQADRLHVRLDPNTVPRELQNLVCSFNHMIGRLEDSFVRLSYFSADIAHELRTPLTNLITQTQVGLGKSRSLEEYRELLYSNLEEQERLTKMVNDMLWLAQSEHGLLKPVWEPLDLAREVRELFDFFEALAEEKHIQLVLEGKAPIIQGDRAMLRRALSNLLSNAIRHTPVGRSVLIRLDSSGEGRALLSVQNPGPEIPAEHLLRIFDRFYRVDPSRQRQSEGAGLGLAIVKSIVEAHEGNIAVISERGVTRFTIRFPRTGDAGNIAMRG